LIKKKWLKTYVPQSVELGYLQTVALFFGDHHSGHTFQQKALSA
jgi:hypothetical protein